MVWGSGWGEWWGWGALAKLIMVCYGKSKFFPPYCLSVARLDIQLFIANSPWKITKFSICFLIRGWKFLP